MSDDGPSSDGADPNRTAAEGIYRVEEFARDHGLSAAQAKDLIERYGADHEALERAAQQMMVEDQI